MKRLYRRPVAAFLAGAMVLVIVTGCAGKTGGTGAPTLARDPQPEQGVAAPAIDGVEIRVTSADRQPTFAVEGSQGQVFTPNSAGDECLVVKADVVTGDVKRLKDWKVTVTDDGGRISESNFSSNTEYTDPDKADTMLWLFVVGKGASSFTLDLPNDEKVGLDPVVKRVEAQP